MTYVLISHTHIRTPEDTRWAYVLIGDPVSEPEVSDVLGGLHEHHGKQYTGRQTRAYSLPVLGIHIGLDALGSGMNIKRGFGGVCGGEYMGHD